MTHKQLKKLATKIANAEKIIQENTNQDLVTKAQDEIILLSSQLGLEDMLYLDDLLRKKLKKI